MAAARAVVALLAVVMVLGAESGWDGGIRMPTEREEGEEGTSWAVLVAGSSGYANYRHQADVCHAYQVLKKGGLKEENIVVFMYDDIAHSPLNPRPGIIINHPQGLDVYAGVPKDYTGRHVSAANLFAVLMGNSTEVVGGSGKVLNSKSNDHIFIYYSDHGGPGVLGLPTLPYIFAADFIGVLRKLHASNRYKKMVIYVEACESGSMFEGLMPEDLDIYVTTASNAVESSWGTYCPGTDPAPPSEYLTCLGDLYSVSWMEDSERHNLKEETLMEQYEMVKKRTSNFNTYNAGSHVMEYGDKTFKSEKLYLYQGFDPANAPGNASMKATHNMAGLSGVISQRDADMLFLWKRYEQLDERSPEKEEVRREISELIHHRKHIDSSVDLIGKLLFGFRNGASMLQAHRPRGMPLVADWDCLKRMVRIFESNCGSLTQYGMKHMRAFANLCNHGASEAVVEAACAGACRNYNFARWDPRSNGYSA